MRTLSQTGWGWGRAMKQFFQLLLCVCSFTLYAAAQNVPAAQDAPSSLLTNFGGRTSISLNGAWQVIVDPYEGLSLIHI